MQVRQTQRDVRKAATRLALAEAAVELFASRGFDETRVEDIAAAVGVTSRTFFLHFPTKTDAAFPDHAERVATLAEVLDAAATDAEADADPDADLDADLTDATMPLLRGIVAAGIRETTGGRIRAQRQRLFHEIDALRARDVLGDLDYEEVIAAHLVRCGRTPFDARRTAIALIGVSRAALTTWVADPTFDPVAAATAALEDVR